MGYTGSMTLAFCPPIWKKIMNPMVQAINRGEIISTEVKEKNKRTTLIYLATVWTALTYIAFGVVGFKN
jgi:hypothetical protein